ncbi:20593_t:CDS:2, partial [Cetraspora pellucida]
QETKELKEITNTQKEELKENRTYITKEKISSVERNNNIETFLEQNNNTFTHNEEVIKVNTHNEEITKTTTQNEPRNEQRDSTLERNTTSSSKKLANIRPEQELHEGSSANKEENPYLQDDVSIIDGISLQENDITQDEQKGSLSPSIEIDNNKRNSTPSKDKDLLPDPILALHNKLATLYLNTELQAENKNTEETSPIME